MCSDGHYRHYNGKCLVIVTPKRASKATCSKDSKGKEKEKVLTEHNPKSRTREKEVKRTKKKRESKTRRLGELVKDKFW